MAKVQILEVKSELGAGTRGSSLGVDAIQVASLDFNSKFFKQHPTTEIPNENKRLFDSTKHPFAKKIVGINIMYKRICETVKKTIENGFFPIILSGDHSNAGGTLAGLKSAYPNSRIGVVWIDAHADLHSPFTSPTGHVHGMPLACSLGEDNLKCQINPIDQETSDQWNLLKNVGGISPKILPEDIIMVGVRDVETQEQSLINEYKIKNFTVDEIRKIGIEKIVKDISIKLQNCDKIYVSFDVDSMDPSMSKGTGTPVVKGISDKEAGHLITGLMANQRICCFEMTEINPTLDSENAMAEIAFEILVKATNQIEQG
jgi:arginase